MSKDLRKQNKSWISSTSNARTTPQYIIPRAIKSAKKPNEDDAVASTSSNSSSDSEDTSGDESERLVTNPLDVQVKKLLAGSASSDFQGSRSHQLSFNGKPMARSRNAHSVMNDIDAPPRLSLTDFAETEQNGGSEEMKELNIGNAMDHPPAKSDSLPSMLSENPGLYNGANKNSFFSRFYKEQGQGHQQVSFGLLNKDTKQSYEDDLFNNNANVKTHSVIVYGYKEADSIQVIQFFNKFGEILEDFQVLKTKNSSTGYYSYGSSRASLPLYLGEGWMKITYDNQSSYMRALKENDAIFKNYYLKVDPFSSDLLKRLKNEKVTVSLCEDEEILETTDTLFPHRIKRSVSSHEDITNVSHVLDIPQESRFKSILDGKAAGFGFFSKDNSESSKRSRVTPENSEHRLRIKGGKQMMLMKDRSSTRSKKISISRPVKYSGNTVVGKALDWAFGWESL